MVSRTWRIGWSALLLILGGCSTLVDGRPDDLAPEQHLIHSRPIDVPDGDHDGATIGPLPLQRDGSVIRDVALELEIFHPCPSDIGVWLAYDADNDGAPEIETPIDLFLARPGDREAPSAWASPVRLDGTYFFQHEPETEDLQGWDTGSLARFFGLDKGGSFYLHVVDSDKGDLGRVVACAVHVQ